MATKTIKNAKNEVIKKSKTKPSGLDIPRLERVNKRLLLVGSILAILLFGGSLTLFVLRVSDKGGSEVVEVVVEEEEDVEVIETEVFESLVEALPKDEIVVDVLNGSGVAGAAGEKATQLEDLGYTVGEIGNAEARSATVILSDLSEEELAEFLDDASELFGVKSVGGGLGDTKSDVQVILGSE